MSLKFAFYADDFTGATDTLATLARSGKRVMLFLDIPQQSHIYRYGSLDAIGIAGAARSMTNDEQKSELNRVAAWMSACTAPILHYKTCSTFDSSPELGSIGLAVSTFKKNIDENTFVAIVGGQPNLGRYCLFGNIFASFKYGGKVFRLDRHPTMSKHPVTPMCESDLRKHLKLQGLEQLGLIPYTAYKMVLSDLRSLISHEAANNNDGLLFDVSDDCDLLNIGNQLADIASYRRVLAVGPSSVAIAISNKIRANYDDAFRCNPASGPVLVMSGSMSPLNSRQIEAATSFLHIPLNVSDILSNPDKTCIELTNIVKRAIDEGKNVLMYTSGVNVHDSTPAAIADATALLLNRVLSVVRPARLGLAGGDTSSRAIKSLDIWGISYSGQVDSGCALCVMHSDNPKLDGMEVMLKGGQMGSENVFELLCSGTQSMPGSV